MAIYIKITINLATIQVVSYHRDVATVLGRTNTETSL